MWPRQGEKHQRIEIYQRVNSPFDKKYMPSQTHLLDGADVTSIPLGEVGQIKLISGCLHVNGGEYTSKGSSYLPSRCCIAMISLPEGTCVDICADEGDSCALYIRMGSAIVSPNDASELLPGELVKFSAKNKDENSAVLEVRAGNKGVEALLLIGEPLREPAYMQGPFVGASKEDFAKVSALSSIERTYSGTTP